MSVYLLLKAIHILAVIAFMGNISTGVFWMRFARATGNVEVLQHTVKGIIRSDRLFTIPGVIMITAAGIFASIKGGLPMLSTGWIFWPIVLFSVSGILFGWKVAPLQGQMRRILAQNAGPVDFNTEAFDKLLRQWEFWGFLALLTPLISFFMMLLKWPLLSPLAS